MAPAKKLRVAVVGASGETGQSIMDALLASPDQFETIALARAESVSKPIYHDLARRGAPVQSVADFTDTEALVPLLTGIDVVICCLTVLVGDVQRAIIDASSKAGVGRFVPNFWATVAPPHGVLGARDLKEDGLNRCKYLHLPYTVIDVGWWFQFSIPRVPSGRLDAVVSYPDRAIAGDGNTRCAVTDLADVGKYVARIIADPRTLNKMVFAYGEVTTQNRIWSSVEALTGETIPRQYLSKEETEETIASTAKTIAEDPTAMEALVRKSMTEYKYSRWIRGDNTPEYAEYLGYLDAKDLYPDFKCKSLDDFIRELVEGSRVANPYVDRPEHMLKLNKDKRTI